MSDADDLDDADREALLRWRLALGPGAEKVGPQFSLDALRSFAAGLDVDPSRIGDLDQALSFVYDERSGNLGASRPYIPRWLASLREFFDHDVVALVQKDAIEKKGLTQLLLEPETLPLLEKNVELVATLISARGLIPDQAREAARQIVHFWANQRRRHEWDVAILVDQSGSMAESVVYSSIMAAIFASIDVLRTRLCFFDTEIVDVTPLLDDPVDVLFTTQLGGGTDIHRAVACAQEHFVEQPERTLMILVSDLFEGGDRAGLVARMRALVDSRVKVVCLLALSDGGKPAYDHGVAAELSAMGIPCFGCTPALLPALIERVMKGQDLAPLLC